ncbi:MAG: FAD-dependent oxidoreductase [Eubacteriales bacterium]|nr:FAD-dependent oxidoreductase [Eubacteriales bacterium]
MDFNLSSSLFTGEQQFNAFESSKIYDVIIIGGGPAGMTAAVYSLRKGMVTGLITRQVGGQMAETAGIENYLGYTYINGVELADKFHDQVMQFGIDFENNTNVKTIKDGLIKEVILEDGRVFKTRTIIVASGKLPRKLNVPGEKELTGHGVAYCAICDAPFYKNKKVVVAGGGNSGIGAAIDLARIATHVTVVQRRDRLKADKILVDKLNQYHNVEILLGHAVKEIAGAGKVEAVIAENRETGERISIPADGIFVEVGSIPNSDLAKGLLDMNETDEIIIDEFGRTNKEGIFAAGDVTDVPYKQIIIACGDAAKAALSATDYILSNPNF